MSAWNNLGCVRAGGIAAVLAASGAALGTEPLLSNHSPTPGVPALATGGSTASGVPAPPGFAWSEVQAVNGEAGGVIGFSVHGHQGQAYRFADDFVVPTGSTWRLDAISLYAYQTGAALPPGASPFGAVSVRVWDGAPDAAGAGVVFGDATTNRLMSASGAGILRAMNTVVTPIGGLPDTSRHVWKVDASLGEAGGEGALVLGEGTYWVDFQITPVDPNGAAFMPAATVAGVRGVAGANGLHQRLGDGWRAAVDPGKPDSAADVPLGAPFILHGVNLCQSDFNFDGTVDPDDLADYIAGYFSVPSHPRADVNGDGVVDPDDLADFIAGYFGGAC